MKSLTLLLAICALLNVIGTEPIQFTNEVGEPTIDVTKYIDIEDFNAIKEFVLANGDFYAHGSRYGCLSHYRFDTLEV